MTLGSEATELDDIELLQERADAQVSDDSTEHKEKLLGLRRTAAGANTSCARGRLRGRSVLLEMILAVGSLNVFFTSSTEYDVQLAMITLTKLRG